MIVVADSSIIKVYGYSYDVSLRDLENTED